jgi:hypothetical protein
MHAQILHTADVFRHAWVVLSLLVGRRGRWKRLGGGGRIVSFGGTTSARADSQNDVIGPLKK